MGGCIPPVLATFQVSIVARSYPICLPEPAHGLEEQLRDDDTTPRAFEQTTASNRSIAARARSGSGGSDVSFFKASVEGYSFAPPGLILIR